METRQTQSLIFAVTVPTRLRKLAENEWDGIVLARAGLERLGFSPTRTEIRFEGGQFFCKPSVKFLFQRVVRESLLSKSVLMIKAQKRFSSR